MPADPSVRASGTLTAVDPAVIGRLDLVGTVVRWLAVAYAAVVTTSVLTGLWSDPVLEADPAPTVGVLPRATAVAFLVLAIASLVAGGATSSTRARTGRVVRVVGVSLSTVVAAYGAYLLAVLVADTEAWAGTAVAHTPSFAAGFTLLVLGGAVPTMLGRREWQVVVGQLACAVVFSLMATIIIAYTYGDPSFGSVVAGRALAFQAALVGLLVSVGTMLFRPGSGILAVAASPGAGGRLLRRFGPLALATPALLLLVAEAQPSWDRVDAVAVVAVGLGIALLVGLALMVRVIDRQAVEVAAAAAAAERARLGLRQQAPVVAGISDVLHLVDVSASDTWEVAAKFRPASGTLAGDTSVVRATPDGSIIVVMVDVTGHGAEPAMKAVRIRDMVMTGLAAGLPPDEAFALGQWAFAGRDTLASAVALVAGVDGRVTMAMAGHPPAIHVHALGADLLPPRGPLLLLAPGHVYEPLELELANGDELVLFSDGIADVQLEDAAGVNQVAALADRLFAEGGDADRTAGLVLGGADDEPTDDQTVVVIRRIG